MDSFGRAVGHMSSALHGFVVSSILISGAIASFFAGYLADAVGRTRAVMTGAFLFGVGAAVEAGAVGLAMFVVGRIVTGAGEGLFLSTVTV
jgi:MFS family permease